MEKEAEQKSKQEPTKPSEPRFGQLSKEEMKVVIDSLRHFRPELFGPKCSNRHAPN